MFKTHIEVETHKVEVVDDIICNKCGKSVRSVPQNNYFHTPIEALEYVSIDKSWGFCSKKDLSTQKADICEPCWDDFCSTFAVPPQVSAYGGGDWEPEDPQLSLFSWKELSGDPNLMSELDETVSNDP